MLRQAAVRGRPLVTKRTALALTTVGAATAGAGYFAANSESTLGLRRQGAFWMRVAPVVFDYYWHFASSSPYVRYQKFLEDKLPATSSTQGEESATIANKERRKALQQELHDKHAPEILQVILDLKGLYVKLGQVLSVTALPIPESYREQFRTLQSDVPGYEEFENTVKPTLERELGTNDLESIFSFIDPIPCGAASIGQAHRATLKDGSDVVVKIQYPEAAWQVPADIQCVGHLLKLWVWTGLVDETAANLSFNDFSNQFLAELDYEAEKNNLQEVHQSSLSSESPYQKRGVIIPKVVPELCTQKVITMSYLRGPKLEEEARRQLELLGIDTKKSLGSMVRDAAEKGATATVQTNDEKAVAGGDVVATTTWKVKISKALGELIGVDGIMYAVRLANRILQWSRVAVATTISVAAPLLPADWESWSKSHEMALQQAQRLALTESWIDALFDVHGYQIFQEGLFNADCHPGNILVLEEEDGSPATQLGLIDYGQCKRLDRSERVRVARLMLAVANNESDEQVATAFRGLDVGTQNDSTEFLAHMARLMFGSITTEFLDHSFHKKLHSMDRITYFPRELSMVYRTSLLLRGLAVSLQVNSSVSEQWRSHAQKAVDEYDMSEFEAVNLLRYDSPTPVQTSSQADFITSVA